VRGNIAHDEPVHNYAGQLNRRWATSPATPQGACGARQGQGRWRRSPGAARIVICGYRGRSGAQARLQAGCRTAVEELARETAGGGRRADRHALGRRRPTLYACALLDEGRIVTLRFKAIAELRRIRRKTPVRARPARPVTSRASASAFPSARTLASRIRGNENVVECLARPARKSGGAQRLAVCPRQERSPAVDRVAPVTESACRWSISPDRGQDELVFDGASFALNADLSVARNCPPSKEHRHAAMDQGRRRLACSGPWCRWSRADKAITRPACWVCATTSARTDFLVCCWRFRRHRFRAVRAIAVDASARPGSRRDAAISIYRASLARRCREAREGAGFPYEVLPIRDAVNGFERSCQTFAGCRADITEENLQARTRGTAVDGDFQQDRRDGGPTAQVGNVVGYARSTAT